MAEMLTFEVMSGKFNVSGIST